MNAKLDVARNSPGGKRSTEEAKGKRSSSFRGYDDTGVGLGFDIDIHTVDGVCRGGGCGWVCGG